MGLYGNYFMETAKSFNQKDTINDVESSYKEQSYDVTSILDSPIFEAFYETSLLVESGTNDSSLVERYNILMEFSIKDIASRIKEAIKRLYEKVKALIKHIQEVFNKKMLKDVEGKLRDFELLYKVSPFTVTAKFDKQLYAFLERNYVHFKFSMIAKSPSEVSSLYDSSCTFVNDSMNKILTGKMDLDINIEASLKSSDGILLRTIASSKDDNWKDTLDSLLDDKVQKSKGKFFKNDKEVEDIAKIISYMKDLFEDTKMVTEYEKVQEKLSSQLAKLSSNKAYFDNRYEFTSNHLHQSDESIPHPDLDKIGGYRELPSEAARYKEIIAIMKKFVEFFTVECEIFNSIISINSKKLRSFESFLTSFNLNTATRIKD